VRESQSLAASLRRARNVRMILFLALLALVAAIIWAFYQLGSGLFNERAMQSVLDDAQKRLGDNSDQYMQEVQTLVTKTQPVITDAFQAQAKADMSKYMEAFGKEREIILVNLEKRLTDSINAHYKKALTEHQSILEAEFPEIKNEEVRQKMMLNMTTAVEKLAKKYYVDELRTQVLALYDAWDQFPAMDENSEDSNIALEDRVIVELIELLTHQLTHSQPATAP
jgi:hypothetical protein